MTNHYGLPTHLTFEEVIFRRSAYGLIWGGHYKDYPCVTKMIMLTTGPHYDKDYKVHRYDDGKEMDEDIVEKYFGHNDEKPYYHKDFRHRRSVTPEVFLKELENLILLGKLKIAPEVYGYGVNISHGVHYGIIVMERADCSLKDIYLTRDLSIQEEQIIIDLVNLLHNTYEMIHGDLTPSNIGVYLSHEKKISNACFFDCQKIQHKSNYTQEEFQKLMKIEEKAYIKKTGGTESPHNPPLPI